MEYRRAAICCEQNTEYRILYPVTAQGGGARQEETYVHKNLPKKRQKMPLISKKMAFHQIKNLLVPIVYL